MLCNCDINIPATSQITSLNASNIDVPILKESLLLTSTVFTCFFKTNKKHLPIVNEICKLIGNSHKLYQFTISTLTTLYLRTHDWFYSTLKSQIVAKLNEMYNHDNLINLINNGINDAQVEMILKFGNLINSCLREKKLESKRAKELETIMESKKFEKIFP